MVTDKTKNFLRDFKETFKNIDWPFFSILLLSLIFPFIYNFLQTFWIGNLGADWLADYQIENSIIILSFEVISVFIVIPVYGFVNKNTKNENEKREKFVIAFTIGLFISILYFIIFCIFSIPFVNHVLNQNDSSLSSKQQKELFIALTFNATIVIINNLLIAYLILSKNYKKILVLSIISFILHISLYFIFLSEVIFKDINLLLVIISITITPLISFTIFMSVIFLANIKKWFFSIRNLQFRKWKKDLKIYRKNSLFIGLENMTWNLFWFIGIMLPWIILGNQGDPAITTGGILADSLFWGVLCTPLTAVCYFQAESHSRKNNIQEHKITLKESVILIIFVGISWLILAPITIEIIWPLMLSNLPKDEIDSAIHWSKKLSWILFGFFYFMLPIKIINTYWFVNGQSFKSFLGVLLGGMIWLLSGIFFFLGIINTPVAITLFYGMGFCAIFLVLLIQLILEFKNVKLWKWYQNLSNTKKEDSQTNQLEFLEDFY